MRRFMAGQMVRGAVEEYLLVRLESLRHFCDGTLTMALLR